MAKTKRPIRAAVLVSGGGTNLQALLDAKAAGKLPLTEFVGVVSSSPKAPALKRAKKSGVAAFTVDVNEYRNSGSPSWRRDFTRAIIKQLKALDAELIITAGFLYVLTKDFAKEFSGRMVNIHPSLLPAFGGAGCYGIHVHERALAHGVKVTGATAHVVVDAVDSGPILLQKAVIVKPDDTPQTLQQRVMEQAEWVIFPKAVHMMCKTLAAGGGIEN
jgi:phosphoribosylglycinamide formyltransferase-1